MKPYTGTTVNGQVVLHDGTMVISSLTGLVVTMSLASGRSDAFAASFTRRQTGIFSFWRAIYVYKSLWFLHSVLQGHGY